ncbi:hypothetical protein BGZ97_001228 [Linnemannia gamsii]|uniref:Enoyl reductase (ER) domain-containing protein n=1 Tax=Linnemannia gamsii TaxID=64522 RepID=A0A9P6UJ87_9FUNG|nr:hypothetical protein BGZ97_001228 [Linnemannia gamsii]
MVNTKNKSIIFVKRPEDYPVAGEHFVLQPTELAPNLEDGDILTRNLYLSLDPYLRGRMDGVEGGYVPCFYLGKPLNGYGMGEVIQSKNAKFPVGSLVFGIITWEHFSHIPPAFNNLIILPAAVRDSKVPLSWYMGALGMTGLTAYGSLKLFANLQSGETIFVSAAMGAVGHLVGQMAKRQGLRVVGSAGSDEKVRILLEELKFDAAFNYKSGKPIVESLREACPEGLDIYYDNVGGEHLEAALELLKRHGRVVVSGMIDDYNRPVPYHIKNLVLIFQKRIKIEGFLCLDFEKEIWPSFTEDVTKWLMDGDIVCKEEIIEGLENAPNAFAANMKGKNLGKGVVKIADL